MRRNRSLLSLLLVVLTLFSFASCSNTPENNTGTLTIRVSDAMPKMIGFEGDDGIVRMTHYGISLKDSTGAELKATDTPMPFYGDTGSFTITGLVSGSYTIDATGYVKNADGYTAIATGTTGKFDLTPSTNETKDILIDTWEDGNAESVTVEVTLPSDVLTGGTGEGTLTYRLTDVDDTDVIAEKSLSVAAESVQEGKYTLTIPESVAPGRYVLIVGFIGTGSEKAYKAASAMLVYPNLPITGSISLDSQSAFDGSFTVTNGLGDIIEVDGKGEYQAENGTIVVTLTKALGENEAVKWYVDGVAASPANEGLKYTFTGIEAGKRTIVGVVYNTETDAAVGEIAINANVTVSAEIVPEPIFTFELNYDGKSYLVTGLKEGAVQEDPEVFEIPSEHEGLPVTEIDSYAFAYKEDIVGRLVIPETVTKIGVGAFRECTGLTGDLIIPDTVVTLGANAFLDCTGFNGTLHIPANISVIGNALFSGCSNLQGELILPNGITDIGREAFENCTGFTGTLGLPNGLKTIGSGAFANCEGFTGDLILPDTITEISNAFANCYGLNGKLVLSKSLAELGFQAFQGCPFTGNLDIPSSITSITDDVLKDADFDNVFIPSSVVQMGSSIFEAYGEREPSHLDIYCEVFSKPEGWDTEWNSRWNVSAEPIDVFWGVSHSDYESIISQSFTPASPSVGVADTTATITCDTAFAHIYYTTNGSEPTKDNGKLYSSPFTVSEGTTVKAVAYVGNGIYSDVATSV